MAAESSTSPLDAHASPVAGTAQRSGKATAAMVVGIVAVLAAVLIPLLGLILGFVAMWFAANARDEVDSLRVKGRGQATAGFVLGILATIVAVGMWIAAIVVNAS